MCDELYCRKLILLVMKHIMFACYETCILSVCFEGSPVGEAVKIGSAKKPNNYIRRLTDEYNGSRVSYGSSPGHLPVTRSELPPHYVRRALGTDKYNTIYSLVPMDGLNKFVEITFIDIFIS
jgi:hypothetical protein